MPRRDWKIVAVFAVAASWPFAALARDDSPSKAPAVVPSASARHLDPSEEAAPLPAGHPVVRPDDDEDEPEQQEDPAARRSPPPGVFQPPPDTADEDASLPAGTIVVDVRDPDNKPIPNAKLVLVILHQSVAKGQSKDNRPVEADGAGRLRLDHLEVGTGVSYWIKDLVGPATFATQPVQLNAMRGMREVLHAYPVVRDLADALVVLKGVLYFEVKDDRIQVEQVVQLFNFGKSAYFPDSLVIRLPKGFTALTSPAQMSDQGVETLEHQGAKVRGTFAPGQHQLEFRWQLPYDGEPDATVDIGLPPHVAVMRVMAASGRDTRLLVDGFPEAQRRTDNQGQHILITEKEVRREEPLSSLHIAIRGLVTPGTGRIVATALASLTVLFGIVLGAGKPSSRKGGAKSERASLLAEIEDLELAHRRGDVGPKTYERARRQLVDAIAETLEPTPE